MVNAIDSGDLEVFLKSINAGASGLDSFDSKDRTPLVKAIMKNSSTGRKMAFALIAAGADLNAQKTNYDYSTSKGYSLTKTVLCIAIETSQVEIVQALLKNGADISKGWGERSFFTFPSDLAIKKLESGKATREDIQVAKLVYSAYKKHLDKRYFEIRTPHSEDPIDRILAMDPDPLWDVSYDYLNKLGKLLGYKSVVKK